MEEDHTMSNEMKLYMCTSTVFSLSLKRHIGIRGCVRRGKKVGHIRDMVAERITPWTYYVPGSM